ncbi:hypothetical protein KO500_05260 [Cellulophaga baltica]|uniref:DUF5995 family protein n=1 Tax=Cellulophaga TaxID=104264 RepID=UPI001C06BA71|nr:MULTISPECIES: DUF5995 family protein [Cellulophaga]MBU2995829.1 hypothetical protein [Cellulophaga baltica]MDO6767224.1 DUF5995 family protein [Cellulophaga sp. 1_MG-2023]
MNKPTTIKEVLVALDEIIEESIVTNSRLGFFAYLYRRTTAEILKEVELGSFENNEQLQRMDVAFANLYIDAYHDYKAGKPVSKCWAYSFVSADEKLSIIQHILLGVNAHINLDLGIATAATMKGKDISDIENDFNKVNDILFNITNEMQNRLSRVSPLLFILDMLIKNTDEQIIDFSMRKAREQSWNSTNYLWTLDDEQLPEAISNLDFIVYKFATILKNPKSIFIKFALKCISFFEEKNISKIINKLKED